jgi:hypothetical protein
LINFSSDFHCIAGFMPYSPYRQNSGCHSPRQQNRVYHFGGQQNGVGNSIRQQNGIRQRGVGLQNGMRYSAAAGRSPVAQTSSSDVIPFRSQPPTTLTSQPQPSTNPPPPPASARPTQESSTTIQAPNLPRNNASSQTTMATVKQSVLSVNVNETNLGTPSTNNPSPQESSSKVKSYYNRKSLSSSTQGKSQDSSSTYTPKDLR